MTQEDRLTRIDAARQHLKEIERKFEEDRNKIYDHIQDLRNASGCTHLDAYGNSTIIDGGGYCNGENFCPYCYYCYKV